MLASRETRVSHQGASIEGVEVDGITANMPPIQNIQVGYGRGITDEEVRRHAPVAFIGSEIRTRFFPDRDPLGKTIQIEGNPYEVVGVAKELGTVFGQSQDRFVMIPIEAYFKTYGSRNGLTLMAKAASQEHLFEAEDEVRMLIDRLWRLKVEADHSVQ